MWRGVTEREATSAWPALPRCPGPLHQGPPQVATEPLNLLLPWSPDVGREALAASSQGGQLSGRPAPLRALGRALPAFQPRQPGIPGMGSSCPVTPCGPTCSLSCVRVPSA